MSPTMRVTDPKQAFFYRLGDVLAERQPDGSPDPDRYGVVVDRLGFAQPRGAFKAAYRVERDDGSCFWADQLDLVLVERAPVQ